MIRAPFKSTLLALVLAGVGHAAHAADPLTLTITQRDANGNLKSETLSFKSLDDMINTYKTEADIKAALSWYDATKSSDAIMDNLGVKFNFKVVVDAQKPSVETTQITMSTETSTGATIVAAKVYKGANQDQALKQMKEDIKAQYSEVQTALAQTTPNSLTAGNPSSVQTQLASSQFESGFTASASQVISTPAITAATTTTTSSTTVSTSAASSSASTSSSASSSSSSSSSTASTAAASSSATSSSTARVTNLLGFGLRFGQYKQGDLKSQTVTIPLGYSWRFDDDERRHVTLSVPLTIGKVQESKVFNAQTSISVGIPVNEAWALTPSIGYGVAGSVDLAQAAQQVSASLTSSYIWSLDNGQSLAMGNMVGYYTTVKMKVDEYTSNPDISNTILRNGLMYSMPIQLDSMGDTGLTAEVSLINTQYLGTELFVTSMNEIGLTLGTNKRVKGATRYMRAGVSYIHAKGASGFGVNVGYWF